MKRLFTALLLIATMFGCAGKKYGFVEGPLRMNAEIPGRFVQVGDPWYIKISLEGSPEVITWKKYILKIYLLGREDEADYGVLNVTSRFFDLRMRPLTEQLYYEIMGDPNIGAEDTFKIPEPTPREEMEPIDGAANWDGHVEVTIEMYELLGWTENGRPIAGKIVAKKETFLVLQCIYCRI